ncbi:MAG: hypothetical protein ACRDL6_07470, partial [Solirubrobacterales bacterium]
LLPGWTGAPALLADGVLAIAILVAVSELLGLFGLLDGVLLVLACLIVGGGGVRLEPMLIRAAHQEAPEPGQREAPELGRLGAIELGAAIAIALLVVAQWAGPTLLALDRGIYGGDSLWYHLPLAAHIAGTGSVTELLFTDPLYLNWFYPQVSELLHADGLMVLGNDFLSPLLNLGWLGLALFAAWCIGRPYGAGAPALAGVAALMSANLLFSRQPGNANNDVVAIALLLASVAILVNASRVSGVWKDGALFTAALAAGLALGTKLTVVPPALALTLGVIWIANPGWRRRAAAIWIGGLALGGGLWYLRNLIVSGNPFPWLDLGPIDKAEELQGRDPYAIVHYIGDSDVWGRFFTPGLEERLGDLWPLVLALAVLGAVVWIWRGGALERMLATVTVAAAIAYLVTPLGASGPEGSPVGFRLNLRYLAPGLALALVLVAIPSPLVRNRERLWRYGALLVFAALIVVSAGAAEQIDTDRIPGSVVLALAVVVVPVTLALLARRGVSRTALAAVGAVILVALAVGGRFEQEDYLEFRYSSAAADYPVDEQPAIELGQGLGVAYDFARETRDRSVALSGTTGALFQYGLWGEDASNEVTYIGERGDRGSFREIPECPEWIGAINADDYDLVVTTPAYHQDDPEAAVRPVQRSWIAAAGNVKRVAGANLVDVWQLTGPLDPVACARVPQSTLSPPE